MTTERDKFARDLFLVDNSSFPPGMAEKDWDERREHHDYAYAIADGLIAADYRKPLVITTPEDLAVLPVGSVVLYHGRAFQHYPEQPGPFDEYQKWKCSDGGFVRSTKDGSSILPATVIHVPKAGQ